MESPDSEGCSVNVWDMQRHLGYQSPPDQTSFGNPEKQMGLDFASSGCIVMEFSTSSVWSWVAWLFATFCSWFSLVSFRQCAHSSEESETALRGARATGLKGKLWKGWRWVSGSNLFSLQEFSRLKIGIFLLHCLSTRRCLFALRCFAGLKTKFLRRNMTETCFCFWVSWKKCFLSFSFLYFTFYHQDSKHTQTKR